MSKIAWTATDGYCYGSIESKYYNWVYNAGNPDGSVGDGKDYNDFYNKTIKQWTDGTDASGNNYRVEETSQDIEILKTEVEARPDSTDPTQVR